MMTTGPVVQQFGDSEGGRSGAGNPRSAPAATTEQIQFQFSLVFRRFAARDPSASPVSS
jgi:hypothetical protein